MPRNPYKNLIRSMEICYNGAHQCDQCIHYDDTNYPECMQKLIKDGCIVIQRLEKNIHRANRKIKRIEQDVYLED